MYYILPKYLYTWLLLLGWFTSGGIVYMQAQKRTIQYQVGNSWFRANYHLEIKGVKGNKFDIIRNQNPIVFDYDKVPQFINYSGEKKFLFVFKDLELAERKHRRNYQMDVSSRGVPNGLKLTSHTRPSFIRDSKSSRKGPKEVQFELEVVESFSGIIVFWLQIIDSQSKMVGNENLSIPISVKFSTPVVGAEEESGNTGKEDISESMNHDELWQYVQEINTEEAYQIFINRFPESDLYDKAIDYANDVRDDKDWAHALTLNTKGGYRRYIASHPYGKYLDEAKRRLNPSASPPRKVVSSQNTNPQDLEQIAWDEARSVGTTEAFMTYLNEFPNGKYKTPALKKIPVTFTPGTITVIEQNNKELLSVRSLAQYVAYPIHLDKIMSVEEEVEYVPDSMSAFQTFSADSNNIQLRIRYDSTTFTTTLVFTFEKREYYHFYFSDSSETAFPIVKIDVRHDPISINEVDGIESDVRMLNLIVEGGNGNYFMGFVDPEDDNQYVYEQALQLDPISQKFYIDKVSLISEGNLASGDYQIEIWDDRKIEKYIHDEIVSVSGGWYLDLVSRLEPWHILLPICFLLLVVIIFRFRRKS